MNKFTLVIIAVISVFLIATANAGQAGDPAAASQDKGLATQASPTAPKKAVGSRRQRAHQEVDQAKIERNAMQTGVSGTKPGKAKLSKRNKAMLEQKEQKKARQKAIKSEMSATTK